MGILETLLGAATVALVGLAINAYRDIAVLKEQQNKQDETIKRLVENEARILELLARSDERMKALEKEH